MREFSRKVYVLGLIFALFVAGYALVGFHKVDTVLQYETEKGIEYKLEHILAQITADLYRAESILDTTELLLRVEELEEHEEHILRFFSEILLENPALFSVYYGNENNKLLHGSGWIPDQDFDLRTRPWYLRAVEQDALIFTEPYLNAYGDHWVISVAKPVYTYENRFLGVAGLDLTLDGVLEFLKLESASPNGCSFFLDQTGGLIQDPAVLEQQNCSGLEPAVIARLVEEPAGNACATVNGIQGYLYWQSLAGSGYTIGTFAPTSDFYDHRAHSTYFIAMMILALAVLFAIFFHLQHRHIVEPIKHLEKDILQISLDDRPKYRVPASKGESFVELRKTINTVLDQTQEHYESVIFQQEELSAAYAQLVAHQEQLHVQGTEIKEHEAKVQFLENHDHLTGLFNRRKFSSDLAGYLKNEQFGAVLMFDLDDFKNINDTLGHLYGDRILRSIALTLKKELGINEVAYRFGGDDFLIIIAGETDHEKISTTVEKVQNCLGEISIINKLPTLLTCSMGIVRYPFDGVSVDELMIKSDLAMYNAKQSGKNRYTFFESGMAASFSERIQIERMLVEAIQSEGFRLLYQPIINANTGEVCLFEALIRIRDNPLSPAVFIAVAEDANLILPIGRWVIKEALAQLSEWKALGRKLVPVSVNLSAKQFYDEGLVQFLAEQIARAGVDPGLIEIEITESVLIDNSQEAIGIIECIRALGIKIALDDFGTGYSSINYITSIPVDRIKFDRSMTEKLLENISVMEGLVAIAHGLDMEVVAEGVEEIEEANLLIEAGCDYLQGYLFSSPIPADDAIHLVRLKYSDLLGI